MTRAVCCAVVVLILDTAGLKTGRSIQTPVFRATTNSVSVDVAVHEGSRAVIDLTAANFEIRDNGVLQVVTDVSRESMPLDVALVIDTSGSVQGRQLEALVRAVQAVARRLKPTDRATLVTFNERVRRLVKASGTDAILSASRSIASGDQTSLRDAVAMALMTDRADDRRSMMILLSDGYDTSSVVGDTAFLEIARRADSVIFVVATIPTSLVSLGVVQAPPILDSLTTITGGRLEVLIRDDDVSSSFLRAIDDFRASYVVRYLATGVAVPGWHDITVGVTRPGKFTVRARRGYFGGASEKLEVRSQK